MFLSQQSLTYKVPVPGPALLQVPTEVPTLTSNFLPPFRDTTFAVHTTCTAAPPREPLPAFRIAGPGPLGSSWAAAQTSCTDRQSEVEPVGTSL